MTQLELDLPHPPRQSNEAQCIYCLRSYVTALGYTPSSCPACGADLKGK